MRKRATAASTTSERLPIDHGSPLRISIETSARPKATSARHVAENQQMPEVSRRRSMGERIACKGYAVKKLRYRLQARAGPRPLQGAWPGVY
jgi:hypothetical protein